MKKILAIIGIGILICGCQGPQIQKAVEALSADVDGLGAQIAAAEPIVTTIVDLDKKAAEPKLSKEAKDSILAKIGETQGYIAGVMGLRAKVTAIRDSLGAMEEKATGKVKEESIPALSAKLDDLSDRLAGFSDGNRKLEELKVKLQKVEEKTPKKAAAPVKPKKKAPAPEKM